MGDRIAVMRQGVLQQVGTPEELYTKPANVFVARFIGSPAMNLVPARSSTARDRAVAGFRPEHLVGRNGRADASHFDARSRSSSTSATSSSFTSPEGHAAAREAAGGAADSRA